MLVCFHCKNDRPQKLLSPGPFVRSPRLFSNLACCVCFLWMLPVSRDLFPVQCLCNLHWLYASVPPLSMYMQEHPSSVCILSALTAPLSLRINVIAQLSVSLRCSPPFFFNTAVSISPLQQDKKRVVLFNLHFIFELKLRFWLRDAEPVKTSCHLHSPPPPRPLLSLHLLISVCPHPPPHTKHESRRVIAQWEGPVSILV